MSDEIAKSLLRIAAPAATIVVVLLVTRVRRLSLREDLRFVWPSGKALIGWLAVWGVWMAVSEVIGKALGIAPPERWGYGTAATIVRVIGIVALAPFAEELVFRGLLFKQLSKTRIRPIGAIAVTAAAFAAVHTQYGRAEVAMIFLDAVLFGFARYASGSLLLTVVMHSIGNAIAVLQRLT